MSQLSMDGVDLCDNLPNPDAVSAQTQNLNETNTLAQNQSFCPSQIVAGGGQGLIQKSSFNNNGKDEEEEEGKERYAGRGREDDEEEEEDNDEVMKEEDEEESEELSSLIRGQSPDNMTDSSYSETGSLLETPHPFSPGTSAEPTSTLTPVVSPETAYPINPVKFTQSDVSLDPLAPSTVAFTTGPLQSTALITTSDPRPACTTDTTSRTENITEELLTSSTEPDFNRGSATSYVGPVPSAEETFTITDRTTRLNTSVPSTAVSATTGPLASTTGPTTVGTFTTGSITSDQEIIPSIPVPTGFSVSTCPAGTIPSSVLLKYLEQLAHKGDDGHLPHYLHQIAEAFVLQKDYQQALWCIQLERLYHQRILDNLNTLQEQWESQCKRTSSDLATQHLDTLKNICRTHSRPGSRDSVHASLDFLRPTVGEGAALLPCSLADQVETGPEQRDSSPQSSDPVIPSIHLTDRISLPVSLAKDREDTGRDLVRRDGFPRSQLTDEQGSDSEGGEAEGGVGHTIPAIKNGLHPSTSGEMDQSKPAEQQGGDLGLAEGKEVKREEEESSVEEVAEALEMDDEGEEDDKEKQKERDSASCQRALPVDNLASGAELEEEQLHQEVPAEEKPYEDTQEESTDTCLHQEACLTQEAHIEPHDSEEEEEEYEVEQADLIREAASLDNMAKLITVEEMSPASGLVSILKKRTVCVDDVSVCSSSEPLPEKPTAKRRVRFRVPDDDEQDVGGGDSCLLLVLLCLVTVVISVGGTALYCALGDAHSSVCQDFSRNADFYFGQIQQGITQMQHWFTPGS